MIGEVFGKKGAGERRQVEIDDIRRRQASR